METKKRRLIIPFLFLIMGMGACNNDKEPQFEIYENHEITACGVEDPLRNFDWLTEWTEKNKKVSESFDIRVELYGNIESQEEFIVCLYTLNRVLPEGYEHPDPYDCKQVYSCSGDRLFINSSEYLQEWNDFFYSETNISQGIIWSRIRIN